MKDVYLKLKQPDQMYIRWHSADSITLPVEGANNHAFVIINKQDAIDFGSYPKLLGAGIIVSEFEADEEELNEIVASINAAH